MIDFLKVIFYEPIFNALVWFYNVLPGHDIGLSIIIITIIIKLITIPFSNSSIKSQKKMQDIQPKLEELKKKYKNKPQEMTKATMKLYKENKVSVGSSCLPMIIQMVILFSLYYALRDLLLKPESLDVLYSFIVNPGTINPMMFGLIDLSKSNIVLAVLAALSQFWVSKMLISKKQPKVPGAKDESMQATLNKQMMYFMPAMIFVFSLAMPSGLPLYWFVSSVIMGIQQTVLFKKKEKNKEIKIDEQTIVIKNEDSK